MRISEKMSSAYEMKAERRHTYEKAWRRQWQRETTCEMKSNLGSCATKPGLRGMSRQERHSEKALAKIVIFRD